MSILRVLFIVEAIASMMCEDISDTVDCSWSIDDIEIELQEELVSVGLMAIKLTGSDEVFQIFMISEHSYRVSSVISFKALLFKCFNNDQ